MQQLITYDFYMVVMNVSGLLITGHYYFLLRRHAYTTHKPLFISTDTAVYQVLCPFIRPFVRSFVVRCFPGNKKDHHAYTSYILLYLLSASSVQQFNHAFCVYPPILIML